MTNPRKTVSIYNIPKLVKLAYLESFTAKNITSGFSKPGIRPLNEMAFSDEDFAPTDVYASNNSENIPPNPETSCAALEPQPSICVPWTEMNEEEPSTSTAETQPEPTYGVRKYLTCCTQVPHMRGAFVQISYPRKITITL
ncbi:hypothetical protein QE152_g25723 [Popillia japonica]|uniref:Uncharacterized protein n=1 Tax=Popillia japonica TaxID=7064 RepID=A0AAW1K0J7_POPJA